MSEARVAGGLAARGFKYRKMKRGKLIVIDGTDGSGKATQTALLVKNLKKSGYKVKIEDFPQYGQKSAGPVEAYLTGRLGTAESLGPYIPSIFYAVDRFSASQRMTESLRNGQIVVCNRYVTANMGHQGGKIKNAQSRLKYYQWLENLEYDFFRIPRPDLNLILHMPAAVAQKLVDHKRPRAYTKHKKRDIHEADLKHLLAAEKTYLEISKKFSYPVVECYQKERILSREEIADLVWKQVKPIL